MRDLFVFCIVLGVLFFGVGEWRGWYLGVASQTPVYVYKKDFVTHATRRTINRDSMPLVVSGDVQRGNVTVSVFFERPISFQTSQQPQPEQKVFERTFSRGQRIDLDQVLAEGHGIYRVQLRFDDATGLFQVRLPTSAQL